MLLNLTKLDKYEIQTTKRWLRDLILINDKGANKYKYDQNLA